MEVSDVPRALHVRLGDDATTGLLALFETAHREVEEDVIAPAIQRLDNRLGEQISAVRDELGAMGEELRAQMGAMGHELRAEMSAMRHELRAEIQAGDQALRLEMRDMRVAIVSEIATLASTLRSEMAGHRVELFKWAFLFWVGQVIALAAIFKS